MTKHVDPNGHPAVPEDKKQDPWYRNQLLWITGGIVGAMLLALATIYFWPSYEENEVVPVAIALDTAKVDSTLEATLITLQPARNDCDVTDSTRTFCSSDPQKIEVLESGELRLANLGEVRICARKPIRNITYRVQLSHNLRFTSALDINEPRCDIFVVSEVPR